MNYEVVSPGKSQYYDGTIENVTCLNTFVSLIFFFFSHIMGEVQIDEDLMLVNHIKHNFFDFQAPLAGHYSSIDSSSCLVTLFL